MKTLIINGSPRPCGVVSQMLAMAAEIAGDDVSQVHVYRADIKPCTGCMACRKTGVCRLERDEAHKVAELLRQADLVIVGTPVYWANMSAGLKNLFDRLVPVFMAESKSGIPKKMLKGKRGIVVTACTTPFPFDRIFGQSGGALRAVKEVLCTGGIRVNAIRIAGTKGRKNIPQKHIDRLTTLMLGARGKIEAGNRR